MVLWLILGIGILMASVYGLRQMAELSPAAYARALRWLAIGLSIIVGLLAFRFGQTWLGSAIMFLAFFCPPIYRRLMRQSPNHASADTPAATMSIEEAAAILGISTNASKAEITKAYRKQIQKNHPDTGGSPYLAEKINQARDVALDHFAAQQSQ